MAMNTSAPPGDDPQPVAISAVLARLDRVTQSGPLQWQARCPAHEDRTPSLSVATGREGIVLVNCHHGCRTEQVLATIGLTLADLYPKARQSDAETGQSAQPQRSHVYHDRDGTPVRKVSKLRRGCWITEHFAGNEWRRGAGQAEPVLYALPLLIASPNDALYVTEGEKDADTLASLGLLATTVASGSWTHVDTQTLAGRDIIVVVDNDQRGWQRGLKSYEVAVAAGASSVRVVRPPEPYNDLSDLIDGGGQSEDLIPVDLERTAPPVPPASPPKSAYRENGCALFVRTPSGVLLSLIQQDLLTPQGLAVWLLLEQRAGNTSMALINRREVGQLLRMAEKCVRSALNELIAAHLVREVKRGQWRVFNPCSSDRRGNVSTAYVFYDRWHRNEPFFLPRSIQKNPADRLEPPVEADGSADSTSCELAEEAGPGFGCSDLLCDWSSTPPGSECRCLNFKPVVA